MFAARAELEGRIVLMTGGSPSAKLRAALTRSGLPVVEKPIDFTELRKLLAGVDAE